jgi:hypothetical protein
MSLMALSTFKTTCEQLMTQQAQLRVTFAFRSRAIQITLRSTQLLLQAPRLLDISRFQFHTLMVLQLHTQMVRM